MATKGKTKVPQQAQTAKSIYDRLVTKRNPFTDRAKKCAKYTIASLFPEESANESTTFSTPYQSIGARGVNNLSSKIMLAMLPPNGPFFRFSLEEEVEKELTQESGDIKNKVEERLAALERRLMRRIETQQIRVTVSEAIKQLVVAGNALLFFPPKEGGAKLYKLNSYVVQRDAVGNVITIITKERVAYAALPDDVQALVDTNGNAQPDQEFDIYTHVYLEDEYFLSYQEIEGKRVPGSDNKFPRDKAPWIPLRMVKTDGQDYGRSFVEEYLGALVSLEGIAKSIVELAAIAANIIFLCNPNGVTNPKHLAACKPGGFVKGRAEDISALQLEKLQDLQVAKAEADDLKATLQYVFMLNSAVQRSGERVTAEEIRWVARELEDTLGGLYSILSQELQLPLVRILLAAEQRTGGIPEFPEGTVEPSITTGLEALGRGQDLEKLNLFVDFVAKVPEGSSGIKLNGLYSRVGTALNIDPRGLVKTDQEMMAEKNMAMQQEMLRGAIPNLAKGFADVNSQDGGMPVQEG